MRCKICEETNPDVICNRCLASMLAHETPSTNMDKAQYDIFSQWLEKHLDVLKKMGVNLPDYKRCEEKCQSSRECFLVKFSFLTVVYMCITSEKLNIPEWLMQSTVKTVMEESVDAYVRDGGVRVSNN